MSFRIWMHYALVTLGVIQEDEYLDDGWKLTDIMAAKNTPVDTFITARDEFTSYCKEMGAVPILDLAWPF